MITLNLFWKKRRLSSEIEFYNTRDIEFLAGVTSFYESTSDISGNSNNNSPSASRNFMSTASIHSSYSHQENVYERLPNQNVARMTVDEPRHSKNDYTDVSDSDIVQTVSINSDND